MALDKDDRRIDELVYERLDAESVGVFIEEGQYALELFPIRLRSERLNRSTDRWAMTRNAWSLASVMVNSSSVHPRSSPAPDRVE